MIALRAGLNHLFYYRFLTGGLCGWLRLGIVCLLFALDTRAAAIAGSGSVPIHKVDGKAVREWMVLGPFPSRNLEADFLAAAGGEAAVRPREGDTVKTSDGKVLTWTRLEAKIDRVNLETLLGYQEWAVAYAYCELASDEPVETALRTQSTSNGRVWLNGEPAGSLTLEWPERLEVPPAIPARLKAGRNPCLIKLMQQVRFEWVFSFQPLPPARVSLNLEIPGLTQGARSGVTVQLYQGGELACRWNWTEARRQVWLYPVTGSYELRITGGAQGAWLPDFVLLPGENRTLTTNLPPAASISGQVLALDGSPQNAVVVQALPVLPRVAHEARPFTPAGAPAIPPVVPLPGFTETTLTDTNGNFSFPNPRPGAYTLRVHGAQGYAAPVIGPGEQAGPVMVREGEALAGVRFMIPEVKKGVWTTIPVSRGLRSLIATTVFRSSAGTLWIGTSDGVVLAYDGTSFQTFAGADIPGNHVNSIAEGPDKSIWIATSGGACRWSEGKITPFPQPVRSVQVFHSGKEGAVWFGTENGLFRNKGPDLTRLGLKEGLPSVVINSVTTARDGALWCGTWDGLARVDGQGIQGAYLFEGMMDYRVGAVHQARDGAIWFVNTQGAYRYDGRSVQRLGREHGLSHNHLGSITETSDGSLWFSSGHGLSRFNGSTVINYTAQDGLPISDVRQMYTDADDVIWCATPNGIGRFDPKGVTSLTARDGLINRGGETAPVFAIEPDPDGRFWLGTEWGGIFRTDGRQLEPVETGVPREYVREIHRDRNGVLWFGTWSGLLKQEAGKVVKVFDQNWVFGLKSDPAGNLWYGHGWNGGGVSCFDPRTGESKTYTVNQGLPNDTVWATEADPDGGVWVGTGTGLARIKNGAVEDWRGKLGIPAGTVFHFRREQDGTLWADSSQGTHSLTGNARVSLRATNGLPDEHIWSSARTKDGILWLGSDSNGLLGYDGKAVTAIDKRDGLPGNRVFTVTPAGDGALLLGLLDRGLARYVPAKSRPSIRLVQAQAGEQAATDFSRLPATETGRRISVQYQETDLRTHPEKRQFWYQLFAPSGKPLFAGVTRERRFEWTPTERGVYRFEVQAIDRDLNYSAPTSFKARVTIPWYANAWILVPAGGGMFGLAAFSIFSGWRSWVSRREAERLREQMLQQERQAREALEHSNRSLEVANKAKSMFLANISHEIRTPLNAVLGFAQILRRDKTLGGEQRRTVGTIERSANHLLGLINEVLDLSKIEAGRMELAEADFDLRELILDLAAMFEPECRRKGLAWRLDWRPNPVEAQGQAPAGESILARGDEGKLRQALINILGNAVKFTDTGEVTFRVAITKLVTEGEGAGRWEVVLEVADTGPGISEAVRGKIFEPFTQAEQGRRKGGTGLGLAIARRQIELMGGVLALESGSGAGARFVIRVCLAAAASRPAARAEGIARLRPGTRLHALVADDVPENRQILGRFLRDVGAEVTLCENGEEALRELTRLEPDIAFLDIWMPGLTGLEVVSRYGEEKAGRRARLVAISAAALIHEQNMYAEKGFDAFLPKPFHHDQLYECLKVQTGVEFDYETDGEAAEPVSAPDGPVDWGRLDGLFKSDAKARGEFLEKYTRTTSAQIGQLRAALDAGNLADASLIAHKCRGTSANFGIRGMVTPMEQLEAAAGEGDASTSRQLLEQAAEAFRLVQAAISGR